ncbi:G-type lectin S-receptor-like serine/threonine-protein kinase B120 [Macadamia integrifolia]|uniref:G-type lectin S-receptor-like serine/threonine-protein kinase B120 n=1 Tax=Macadamia integrifolia TaxID=60698 RepID=UPI001C501173|nr:G-type lectin S-receptor-like serine/threonine-protein kinase B120 [Macadamia integrifolia]
MKGIGYSVFLCFCVSFFFFSSNFYLFLLPHCMAIDAISSSQSITDGETLVSAGGIFELGFFSPGNCSNRYVGIWYKKTSYTHVVWVLNNMKPIILAGTLTINSEGNLVLLDGKQNLIWYTNASASSNNRIAILDDWGNFAHKDPNGSSVLWQSFDHPSNTFIPNMKLGGNDELGIYQTLTSWKSKNDPAPRNFVLNRDRKSLQKIFIVKGSVATVMNWTEEMKHWRSGQWNGRSFIRALGVPQDYINGITFTDDGYGGQYYTYSTSNSSNIATEVLDSNGNIEKKE